MQEPAKDLQPPALGMSPFLPSSAARHIHLGKGVPVEALAWAVGLDLHQLDAFDGSVLLIPGVLADAAEGLAGGLKRGEVATGVLPQASCVLIRKVMDGAQDCNPVSGMHPCNKPPAFGGSAGGLLLGASRGAAPVWSAGWYSTASTTVMALRLSEEP